MPGCWVYLLRCADGSLYTGTTRHAEVTTRVSEHNLGLNAAYTRRRRPVVLAYASHFAQITDAIACERQIKGWSREKKEALIRGDFEALPDLARRGRKVGPELTS